MFVTALSALAMASSTTASSFNYEDFNWGTDDNYCGSAYTTQSPINIDTLSGNGLKECPSRAHLNWQLGHASNYELTNTGHSLKVTPSNSGQNTGFLMNNFNFDGQHESYCLSQFHVHWGGANSFHGSEHTINGQSAALEMHFVHYDCKYDDITAALEAWQNDKSVGNVLAVVAVLYVPTNDPNQENVFLKHIVDHAYYVQNHGATRNLPASANYNMNWLIPSNIHNNPAFLYYEGSLTTPGCNPVVDWYVLADVMYVTEDQLQELRTNLYDEEEHLIDHNCRPVQTNLNDVYHCGHVKGAIDDHDDSGIHHGHFDASDDDDE